MFRFENLIFLLLCAWTCAVVPLQVPSDVQLQEGSVTNCSTFIFNATLEYGTGYEYYLTRKFMMGWISVVVNNGSDYMPPGWYGYNGIPHLAQSWEFTFYCSDCKPFVILACYDKKGCSFSGDVTMSQYSEAKTGCHGNSVCEEEGQIERIVQIDYYEYNQYCWVPSDSVPNSTKVVLNKHDEGKS